MATWEDVTFRIAKQTDKTLCDSMRTVFAEGPYKCKGPA